MTPQRGGDRGPAPRLCRPGYVLAASVPRAKCSLFPLRNWHLDPVWGLGRVPLHAGSCSPETPADVPRCAPRGAALPLGVPPRLREVPPRASPQPVGDPRRQAGEESTGDPQGASWARRLTSGGARRQQGPGQGEQEGAGGGRGRRARCHGRRPSVQQLSGPGGGRAPSHASAEQGGRASRPEGFRAARREIGAPRAAPGPPTSQSRLSFF